MRMIDYKHRGRGFYILRTSLLLVTEKLGEKAAKRLRRSQPPSPVVNRWKLQVNNKGIDIFWIQGVEISSNLIFFITFFLFISFNSKNCIIQKQKINRSKVLSKNIIVAWRRAFGPEYSTEIDGRESPDPNGAIYCGIRRVSAKFSFTYVIAIFNPFPNWNECYNGDCMVYYSPFGAKVWW